ncbi:MAG: permease [Prevotella sp.]|nr:permease [Prevotella sp.]
MGMIGGGILSKMRLERLLTPWVKQIQEQSVNETEKWNVEKVPFVQRFPLILRDAWDIVRGVFFYIIIGISIGAGIHGFVPDEFFAQWMGADNWFAVPASVILAVPMYANAAGIVPIVQVFVTKGIPIGTALAFMMAVVGLSIPEATMLKKVMTWRLVGIFFGVTTLIITALGYLFNIIL